MFNQDIMKNCIVYLSSKLKERNLTLNETKLYKLLWFASLHYADNNWDLLFPDLFIKKGYWPVPELLFEYIDEVKTKTTNSDDFIHISTSIFKNYKENKIKHLKHFDNDFLTNTMKDSLDYSVNKYWNKSATELSNITHEKWTAWDLASSWSVIDLTIDMSNFEMKDLITERLNEIKVLLKTLRYA